MKNRKMMIVLAMVLGLMYAVPALADDDNGFEGVTRCKMCHKGVKKGEQFEIWQKSKHAEAYTVLASAEGLARAADAVTNAECLSCHVTGAGADASLLGKKYKLEDGVGCESCHGGGKKYYKSKTMKGITAGTIEAASVGLVTPTEETCKKCHNDSAHEQEAFVYADRLKTIAHPKP